MPFGGFELVVVLLIILLVFGVGKLPEVGAGLGTGLREFKDSLHGGSREVDKEDDQPKLPR